MTEELERLRRTKEENEACELCDRIRDLEQGYRQLKRELEELKPKPLLSVPVKR